MLEIPITYDVLLQAEGNALCHGDLTTYKGKEIGYSISDEKQSLVCPKSCVPHCENTLFLVWKLQSLKCGLFTAHVT